MTETVNPAKSKYRDPHTVRSLGNLLKNEDSLYLQQHSHNPVDWNPWNDVALARAKSENKPIFLSIGYSSCHWCHVMEKEIFEKDDVAELLNRNFISIKVDREERPDLDAVYMDAVVSMTGSGGWPMSVFLTPDLKPFFSGTYFPHDQFISILERIAEIFRTRRDEVDSQADLVYRHIASEPKVSGGEIVTVDEIARGAEKVITAFDNTWGGLISQNKFPLPSLWTFILRHYRKSGDRRYAGMIRKTLDRMGDGGIFDQIGGGFMRYTVEQTWLVPHFEKMLYDNAQLASLYLEAAAVFDDDNYRRIGADTLNFMIDEFSDERSGFFSSFDADSEGEEGRFYLWTADEINEIAGDEGPALAALLGITEKGNFEGKNIPTRRADPAKVAQQFGLEEQAASGLIDKWRKKLYDYRAKRVWPGLDKKIISSWNGLAIAAMARGYCVLEDERYLQAANRTADFLWQTHRRADGSLHRNSNGGKASNEGILDDYAFVAEGLLQLFMAGGDPVYLERALSIIDYAIEHFGRTEGGFYFTNSSAPAPMGRKIELFDNVRPAGNSIMLQALITASAITGRHGYRDLAEKTLSAYGTLMKEAATEMALWQDAAAKINGPFHEVVVVAEKPDSQAYELSSTVKKLLPAGAIIINKYEASDDGKLHQLAEPVKDKKTIDGKAAAYVCRWGACDQPTTDPQQLKAKILSGWCC